ncbi:MAG: histidine kinase dimerization/phospho-acceptor domain-containing protein, partial [Brevundimonas mediterranea]
MTSTEDRIAPHAPPPPLEGSLSGASLADAGLSEAGWREAPRRGRGFSLRTLIVLRWLTILGQSVAILTASQGLHFPLPLWPCLIVIAVSAAVNVGAMARVRRLEASLPDGRTTAVHLGFDIFQLGLLLGLTGGLENPFCLLLVAPVTIAAAALPARQALLLGLLALIAVGVLFFWSEPLPWRAHENFHLPLLYRLGMAMALVTGVVFTAGYAWRVAADAEKLELALATTQDVLQREQRLAALGGLAAAAAHELGTPLATIQVVAKELQRASAPDSDAAEDAALILQQAERCRGILTQLSQQPEGDDALYADVALK